MSFRKNSNWNEKNELKVFLIFKKLEKECFPRGKQIELSRQMAKNTNLSEGSISAKVGNYKSVAGINNNSNASKYTKLFYLKYKSLSIKEVEQIIDIGIITTNEIVNLVEKDEVINSETGDAILEEAVVETFSPISKTGFALGGLGLLFGLPF